MLEFMWRIAGVLFVCTCLCENGLTGEDAILPVIRAGVVQHISNCRSGSASFRRSWHQHEGQQKTELSGEIEWDEGYLCFEGSLRETRPEKGLDLTEESKVWLARSQEQTVFRIDGEKKRADRSSSFITIYRVDTMRGTPLERYFIDPAGLLTSVQIMAANSPAKFLLAADDPTHTFLSRSIARGETESEVIVSLEFPHSIKTEIVFDLSMGGLWRQYSSQCKVTGGIQFEKCDRSWQQNDDGLWYPSVSRNVARLGSEQGKIRATTELTIDRFSHLHKRKYDTAVGLDMFGEIPQDAFVFEQNAAGFLVEEPKGKQRPGQFAGELRKLAEELRSSGLGAGGK